MALRSPLPDIDIPEVSITEFVLARALERGDKAALVDGPSGRTITYGELAAAVSAVGSGLTARGFKKGDVFAIFLPNLPEYAIAWLGVASVGGVITTVNPLYTPQEISYQLQDAGARYLVTIPQFLDRAQKAGEEVRLEEMFVLGEAEGATPFSALMGEPVKAPSVQIESKEDVVVLPYSSGTTGFPKGVMLTHYNLVSNILQSGRCIRISDDERIIAVLPFFHIYGMVVIMQLGLYHGATIVTMPRFDLKEFLGIIQEHKITRAFLVPPIILALAKHPMVEEFDLSSLRNILSGAAPLGADLQQACGERLGTLVTQGYGMTEASPVTHAVMDDPRANRPGSIGPLIPNTEGRVVDVSTGEDLGPGEDGEIWVRGPQVMKGYLNNDAATAATVDREGWLHTGDIGHADEDGYFYITDRVKELIKYKGFQVAPAELEALLVSHPQVADAAVIGIPDEEAGELPKAFVVLQEEASPEKILAWVSEHVSPQKRIRRIEVVGEIPKSASGKILRRVLKEKEATGS
jgi:acyl-CoA synthetase (AMP-forming)/AMP-acid ligase II